MAGSEQLLDRDQNRTVRNRGIRRRELVTGALAAAGIGGAALGLGFRGRAGLSPEERSMMEQARLLLHQNTRETQNQAVGLYREVVRSAPRNADAWGMVGYAYALASHWRARTESESLRERARMAGQSALDLDPGNACGELALAMARPFLGVNDWLPRDTGLRRALYRQPENPDVLFSLGYMLRFTGHPAEAVAMCDRINPRYHTPIVYNVWIRALWGAGRTERAERKLAKAASLFPSHKTIWRTGLEVLMFSGRAHEAISIARDSHTRPSSVSENELEALVAIATNLQDDRRRHSDRFMSALKQNARGGASRAIDAIRFASMSGRVEDAFAIADAYFFSRGFEISDSLGNGSFSPIDQRHTNFLFEPPTSAMRTDRRFTKLTEDLGLERYWRRAARPPEYRLHNSPRSG
jgi:tetratricopeptide (TPR) repeat protein